MAAEGEEARGPTQSTGFSDGSKGHKEVKQVWQVPADVGGHPWQESSHHEQSTGED